MRKRGILALLLIMAVCALAMVFAACDAVLNATKGNDVTFYVDGEEYAKVALDENFALPANPTKEGYTFVGWCTDQALSVEFDATSVKVAANKTDLSVYAKFVQNGTASTDPDEGEGQGGDTEQAKEYSVTFYVDGEEYAKVGLNATFALPQAPTKEGYTFKGWYTDLNLSAVFDATSVSVLLADKNLSVYAKFEKNADVPTDPNEGEGEGGGTEQTTEYNAIFYVNGEEYAKVVLNGSFEYPAAPVEEGYDFKGWYADADFTHLFVITIEDLNAPAQDRFAYAKFEKNSTPIDPNEGEGEGQGTVVEEEAQKEMLQKALAALAYRPIAADDTFVSANFSFESTYKQEAFGKVRQQQIFRFKIDDSKVMYSDEDEDIFYFERKEDKIYFYFPVSYSQPSGFRCDEMDLSQVRKYVEGLLKTAFYPLPEVVVGDILDPTCFVVDKYKGCRYVGSAISVELDGIPCVFTVEDASLTEEGVLEIKIGGKVAELTEEQKEEFSQWADIDLITTTRFSLTLRVFDVGTTEITLPEPVEVPVIPQEVVQKIEDEIKTYLNAWLEEHATVEIEDQSEQLVCDLKQVKAQFALITESAYYAAELKEVSFEDGEYTVRFSWNGGMVDSSFFVFAKTLSNNVVGESIEHATANMDEFLTAWAESHATRELEDQKTTLANDLTESAHAFAIYTTLGDTYYPEVTYVKFSREGVYTVELSWNGGEVKRVFTVAAVLIPGGTFTEQQIAVASDKVQEFLDSWVEINASKDVAIDRNAMLKNDLIEAKSAFAIKTAGRNYSATIDSVTYDRGVYTVKVSWNKGEAEQTFTVKAKTLTYTNWAGKNSDLTEYSYYKDGIDDLLEEIATAYINTANKIQATLGSGTHEFNGFLSHYGWDATFGFDAFGYNYALHLKGNLNLDDPARSDYGVVIETGDGTELYGLYYKGASTAADSKLYLQYPVYDESGAMRYEYKYISYFDLMGWLGAEMEAQNTVAMQEPGIPWFERNRIETAEDLMRYYFGSDGRVILSVIKMIATPYVRSDGRLMLDFNLAKINDMIQDIFVGLNLGTPDVLKDFDFDLATMYGLKGHLSVSVMINDDNEISDVEISLNIPRDCTFHRSENDEEGINIPSFGVALYLEDFRFVNDYSVRGVVPTDAINTATYFSPLNFDLEGDVYVNYTEGTETTVDATFHYQFLTDINPFEIYTNGISSTAKVALVIKKNALDGPFAFDADSAIDFLTVTYDQQRMLFIISGTAFCDIDQPHVFSLKDKSMGDLISEFVSWLGLDNWDGLNFDPERGIYLDDTKENWPARESAQVVFGNKLVQRLMQYYMKRASMSHEWDEDQAVAEAMDEDTVMESYSYAELLSAAKDLFDELVQMGAISYDFDSASFALKLDDGAKSKIYTLMEKAGFYFDLPTVEVYLNDKGYDNGFFLKVEENTLHVELLIQKSFDEIDTLTVSLSVEVEDFATYLVNVTVFDDGTFDVILQIKDAEGNNVKKMIMDFTNTRFSWGNDTQAKLDSIILPDDQLGNDVWSAPGIMNGYGRDPMVNILDKFLSFLSIDQIEPLVEALGKAVIRTYVG